MYLQCLCQIKKKSIYVLVSKELIKEDHPNDKAKQKQILERVKEANRSSTNQKYHSDGHA